MLQGSSYVDRVSALVALRSSTTTITGTSNNTSKLESLMFGGPSASLAIELAEDSLFLRPYVPSPFIRTPILECDSSLVPRRIRDREHMPSNDSLLQGRLTLRLAKAKRIKSLSVRLVSTYNIEFGEPDYRCESGQTTVSEVSLLETDGTNRVWVKGEHSFLFTLVIPSSTAPFQRCEFGSIEHKIVAVAEGDGFANTNVTAEVPIFLAANPAP